MKPVRARGTVRAVGWGVALLALSVAAAGGIAMWREWRAAVWRGSAWHPQVAAAEVVLIREAAEWRVESVGALGSNESYDPEDPIRMKKLYTLAADEWGDPRVWKRRWRLGPNLPGARPTAEGAMARAALADAIREGVIPWPRGIAAADTALEWRPRELLLNGVARSRWVGAIPAAAVLVGAVLVYRARARREEGVCAGCGYSLAGLVGAVCPECGTRG